MRGVKIVLEAVIFSIAFAACATTQVKKDSEPWPATAMTADDFKGYFDENKSSLDPMEGIWSVSTNSKWTNITSGLRGENNYPNMYKIAIMRDPSDATVFNAWVLDSTIPKWVSGMLKARYTRTAMRSVYQELWYLGDFSKEERNITLQRNALIRTVESIAEHPFNYENDTVKLKLYPMADEVETAPAENTGN